MVHILSTHGLLLSFNLLNFQPNAPGLCSPPQPINDKSGLHHFKAVAETSDPVSPIATGNRSMQEFSTPGLSSNMTFNVPATGATSTPAKQPFTATIEPKKYPSSEPSANTFGSKPPPIGLFGSNAGSFGFGNKPAEGLPFGSSDFGAKKDSGVKPMGFGSTVFGAAAANPIAPGNTVAGKLALRLYVYFIP